MVTGECAQHGHWERSDGGVHCPQCPWQAVTANGYCGIHGFYGGFTCPGCTQQADATQQRVAGALERIAAAFEQPEPSRIPADPTAREILREMADPVREAADHPEDVIVCGRRLDLLIERWIRDPKNSSHIAQAVNHHWMIGPHGKQEPSR